MNAITAQHTVSQFLPIRVYRVSSIAYIAFAYSYFNYVGRSMMQIKCEDFVLAVDMNE